jgi:hypothetical protein
MRTPISILSMVVAVACARGYPAHGPAGRGAGGGIAGASGDAGSGGGGSGGTGESDAGPLWAHGPSVLYRIDPATLEVVASTPFTFPADVLAQVTDVAESRSGRLLAVAGSTICDLDGETGELRARTTLTVGLINSLAFAPDPSGKDVLLVGTQSGEVLRARPDGSTDHVGQFPSWLSGDFAWVDGSGLVAALRSPDGAGDDVLARLDPASGAVEVLGPVGTAGLYGIAVGGDGLLGFTSGGTVLRLDLASGAGTVVASGQAEYWGAASNRR